MDSVKAPSPVDGVPVRDDVLRTMTLHELLAELGEHVCAQIGQANGGREVRGAEFYDPFDVQAGDPDVVLLAPSAGGGDAAAYEQLAQHAVAAGAAAVAIKCVDDDLPMLGAIAHRRGLVFLRLPERLSWRLFDALLAQSFGERRHSEDAHRNRGTEPLYALANELASFFGGSVAVEDLGRRIIAYSSVPGQLIDALRTQGILTRQVPGSPFNDDQYRTVLRATEPIKYPRLGDEEPRVAMAIRAGRLPLGTIWVIDASGEPGLTAEQRERVVTAASVAAAHMLDNIQVRNATQIPRENRLRTLLDGHQVVGSELAELGMTEERGAALLAFSPPAVEHGSVLAQLRSTVQRHLSLHHTETVTLTRGTSVYALVTHDPTRPLGELVAPLLPIIDRLITPGTLVALPGIAHRASSVAGLREIADRLLALAAGPAPRFATPEQAGSPAPPAARIVTVDLLRPRLLFEQVEKLFAAAPELRDPALRALMTDSPEFATTLAAWCASFGSIARTARALGVHENTVRYRLRQIEQHTELPLGEPDMMLAVWLQLRADTPPHTPVA
ncbi:hypothetical protein JOF28_002088 [Leucobacter exalbidus]|uniref:PucR C-terminal helix-turn-helix domain-containing protein n=1 Tax=Leucobacter exalbidus TaxID=662960 RepID=A0A940PXD1_9MICO|nr:helix-turn-helix domain-containing protein [Leucobacter exalbidus]MBP1326856.1 hypothetical protein [Leucobacter exalbidus]